jgi:hypothetical protein
MPEPGWTWQWAPADDVFRELVEHNEAATVWIGPPENPGTDGALLRLTDAEGRTVAERELFDIVHKPDWKRGPDDLVEA